MNEHRPPVRSLALIGMLAVGMTVAAVYLFLNTTAPLTMKDDGFQISAGRRMALKTGTQLLVKEEGTTFRGADEQQVLNTSPIYYVSGDAIILPYDMIYVNARNKTFWRAERFKAVRVAENEVLYEKQRLNDRGFLYDGRNTYVFLEEMVLTINGKTQSVGALSCIQLYSSDTYTLYDTHSRKIQAERLYQDAVEAAGKDYRIDLANDILYDKEQERTLLFQRSDLLEELKGE